MKTEVDLVGLNKIRAVVADDEPPARRRLIHLLEQKDDVEVIAQARNVSEVERALEMHESIDALFLDINMPGEDGVEFARRFEGWVPIVFVTAYREHAVDAFGVSAIDYLVKPVESSRLDETLRRIRERLSAQHEAKEIDASKPSGKLGLSVRGGVRLVQFEEIVGILAQDDYTEVILADGSSELVGITMKAWEDRLPAHSFLRVHRSAIIAKHRLTRLERVGSRWLAQVAGASQSIPVSRSMATEIRFDLRQDLIGEA